MNIKLKSGNFASVNNNTKSGYKGLWKRSNGKWSVRIVCKGKRYNLGTFNDKDYAAEIYNKMAKKLHKEYAKTNEVNHVIA
jgi:hypothetical protein